MDPKIVPFDESHLASAASLVARRYQDLLSKVPCLPAQYGEVSTLAGLLAEMIRSGSGATAIRDRQVVGFLAAWSLPSILGRPSAFSPEWANAATGADARRVTEALYAHLAPQWRDQGCHSHWVSLLADDAAGLECWQWLGFGMVAADGVRSLEPPPYSPTVAHVRKAGPEDLEAVLRLDAALSRHLAGSPIYIIDEECPTAEEYEAWLTDDNTAIWIGEDGDKPIAFLTIGPAVQDACTIIRDQGTASIITAYTDEMRRGEGVATAMLDHGLNWARSRGYVRCAVDFEPMNCWARRFWLRYFEPVAFTVVRHTDALDGDARGT